MAIISGLVKNKLDNPAANIKVKVHRNDTWEVIGEGITGDGVTPFTEGDPYFNDVEFLLDFEGINDSTNITDKSKNSLVVTNTNNVLIKTAIKATGSSSGYFNGSNSYLSLENHRLCINNCPFTLECKFYLIGVNGSYGHIADSRVTDSDNFCLGINSAKALYVYSNNAIRITSSTILLNAWHDVAVTMDVNGNIKKYLNGIEISSWNKGTTKFNNPGFYIGRYFNSVSWIFYGYIDQLRFTKNIVRYQTDYTPSTIAHPTKMASFGGELGTYNIKTKDYVGEVSIIALADDTISNRTHLIERKILA